VSIGKLMGGQWAPLITGGGGSRSSGLPAGFPTVVTSRHAGGGVYADDFQSVSVGASGTTSQWVATQAGSGGGSAGLAGGGGTNSGILQLATGATINDRITVEQAFRTTASASWFSIGGGGGSQGGFTMFMRAGFGTTRTTCIHAFGLVESGITFGADIVTDPDTVLGAGTSMSLVITRNTSAYSGDAADDVIARFYDAGGSDQSFVLVAGGSVTSSHVNFEFSRPQGSSTISGYVNGVLAGTFTASNNSWLARPHFGVITGAAQARQLNIDAILLENQLSPVR
jgi:hypothetical protein